MHGTIIWKEKLDAAVKSEKERLASEEALHRFSVVERYLAGELSIKKSMDLLGCGKSTFYRLISKYDEQLGPAVLLKDPRGRKAGVRLLDSGVEEIVSKAIKKKYQGGAGSFTAVWREVKERCEEEELPVPSLGAVTSRIKAIGLKGLHRLKHGAASASDKYGVKTGKVKVNRPLELTQIDHTKADVILCDEQNREPIGRPWLTVLIDVWSRVIISYYLSLHAPSAVSIAATMAFAVGDKRDYLRLVECEDVRYPFSGKPELIQADNAREFRSNNLVKACVRNNIKIIWRPLGAKHYGGHVERLIGTLMGRVHSLPGTTFSNTEQRKGYDSEKYAVMTFKEFSAWFAREIQDYHATIHRSLGRSPGDAWHEYFNGVAFGSGLSARECENFRIDFLPEQHRTISPKGIQFSNSFYYAQELQPHVGKRVAIKYNPLSTKNIWVWLNGIWVKAPYSDLSRNDSNLEFERIERLGRKREASWVSEEEVAKNKNKSSEIVSTAKKESKRTKKRSAATKAYREFVEGAKPPSTEKGLTVEIDYSKKPMPFSSEG
ncbi:Mu transposase C-terminal domain-containing protein [Pseudomonas panipatensis]|uniref:Mu transposase C-terminal domain-containing protein n=1 Tax=Pseudomonas panipatensis TaxID=428992 RepID=UPI0035AE4531